MMNGIVALHSPPMRKDAAEKKGTLLRSVGCVESCMTSELFTKKFKHVVAKCYPALLLRTIEACSCCFGSAFSPSLRSGQER